MQWKSRGEIQARLYWDSCCSMRQQEQETGPLLALRGVVIWPIKGVRSRKWQPTPVLLPGESHGQRSLVGCCLWGPTESDTTEVTQQQQQQWRQICALGRRGGVGGQPTPFVVLVQGACAVPCFCSRHLPNGSWVLAFLQVVDYLLQLHARAVIFSPSVSQYFVAQGHVCLGVSIALKGFRSQPVSDIVTKIKRVRF